MLMAFCTFTTPVRTLLAISRWPFSLAIRASYSLFLFDALPTDEPFVYPRRLFFKSSRKMLRIMKGFLILLSLSLSEIWTAGEQFEDIPNKSLDCLPLHNDETKGESRCSKYAPAFLSITGNSALFFSPKTMQGTWLSQDIAALTEAFFLLVVNISTRAGPCAEILERATCILSSITCDSFAHGTKICHSFR